MSRPTSAWALPDDTSAETFAQRIARHLDAQVVAVEPRHVKLLDTFDDRLWNAGVRLLAERRAPRDWVVRLEDPQGGRVSGRYEATDCPRWPTELPAGLLREAVEAPSDVRCWLPVAEADVARFRVEVRDALDKLVLRLLVSDWHTPDGTRHGLVRLRPVRGYDAALAKGVKALKASGAIRGVDPWAGLREASGHPAGAYQAKPDVALAPDLRSDVALRRLLAAMRDVMAANQPGMLDALDIEFLHEYRVALRRSRTLLKVLRKALPAAEVERVRPWLKELGGVTGPVRDLDVHLQQLPEMATWLPEEMHGDLTPLEDLLRREQASAQKGLVAWLGARKQVRRIHRYEAFVDAPPSPHPRASHALWPIGAFAGRRTHRQYLKVREAGRAITPETPDPVLHELRKEVKSLRYLPELLAGAMPAELCADAVKRVKPLQSVLGELQDAYVQAEAMEGFASQLVAEDAPARTLLAMGALVQRMHTRRAVARDQFAEAFAAFDTPETEAAFRALREAVPAEPVVPEEAP